MEFRVSSAYISFFGISQRFFQYTIGFLVVFYADQIFSECKLNVSFR